MNAIVGYVITAFVSGLFGFGIAIMCASGSLSDKEEQIIKLENQLINNQQTK